LSSCLLQGHCQLEKKQVPRSRFALLSGRQINKRFALLSEQQAQQTLRAPVGTTMVNRSSQARSMVPTSSRVALRASSQASSRE
jgi:hypothetical protein